MYIYTYLCVCVCVCVRVCVCIYIYIYICVYTYICVYIYIHVYIHMCVHIRAHQIIIQSQSPFPVLIHAALTPPDITPAPTLAGRTAPARAGCACEVGRVCMLRGVQAVRDEVVVVVRHF